MNLNFSFEIMTTFNMFGLNLRTTHVYVCFLLKQFQVVATENVNPVAAEANIDCALATEKLDGTCCYVSLYQGEPVSHSWFC